jgi:GxxExxY protein
MNENEVSKKVISCAIEVHKTIGPGLLESIYEDALCHEFKLQGLKFVRQKPVPITYKNIKLGTDLRLDLCVENLVIIDLKAKEKLSSIDKAQILSYLRLCEIKLGIILNFHVPLMRDGICRDVNNLIE